MKPLATAGGFSLSKKIFDKPVAGKKLPRHCHPLHQFLLKSFQISGRKNCRETILLWKMRFSAAKIARAHRTRRWARLKLERDEALSSFLGFFDRLSFPPVVGGFCAPQCLACILKKRHPLNTFRGCCGAPGAIRTRGLPLRSMAYHVIHGSDVTSNIIPYAE